MLFSASLYMLLPACWLGMDQGKKNSEDMSLAHLTTMKWLRLARDLQVATSIKA
jgi:hypothetical protein